MKVIHIFAIALLILGSVTACAYAIKPLLLKSDCDFAARTIDTIWHNASEFDSNRDLLKALEPHTSFYTQYCTE